MSYRAPVAGRRGRGRIFLPPITQSSNDTSDRIVAVANRTKLEADTAAMFYAIMNLDVLRPQDSYFMPLVASDSSTVGVIPDQIGTGRKFDTQRRRANALSESQTWQPLAYVF